MPELLHPSERPNKLTNHEIGAFKRVPALVIPWGVKAVFIEDWLFDQGGADAAYIGAASVALRLGMSKDNVEAHRRWLYGLDFYAVIRRARGEAWGWVPQLPLGCRLRGRTDEAKDECARRIAAYVEGSDSPRSAGVPRSTSPGGPPSARAGVAGYARPGVAGSARGGVGGASFSASGASAQTLAQDGDRDRTRGGAHAPEAEQEDAPAPRAIDARPRAEVEREGLERIADILKQQRRGPDV